MTYNAREGIEPSYIESESIILTIVLTGNNLVAHVGVEPTIRESKSPVLPLH